MSFNTAGGEVSFWLPPLAAFVISTITSMGGVSGAFLLLPFQLGVLGISSPAVTGTNLLYNLVATPGGILRYWREGRMLWTLTLVIGAGSIPGMAAGYWLRVRHLADLDRFRLFVAIVLVLLGLRMVADALGRATRGSGSEGGGGAHDRAARVKEPVRVGWHYELHHGGRRHRFSLPGMLLLSVAVGVVGGIYGIGGGALIAPFCIWLYRLPVHAIAGATLAATLLSSIVGVLLYAWMPAPPGVQTTPNWLLGVQFGIGGLAGTYAGARLQKYVPQRVLKGLLGLVSLVVGLRFLA